MKPIDIDRLQIAVCGLNTELEFTSFYLTLREVKHIRRCLEFYSLFHPNLPVHEGDNFSEALYSRFRLFGKVSLRGGSHSRRSHLKRLGQQCSYQGCPERDALTIDHIRPIMHGGNGPDNLQLLCPKHHLLKELRSILFFKELEVAEIKRKIELTETDENPEILGYQTIGTGRLRREDDVS